MKKVKSRSKPFLTAVSLVVIVASLACAAEETDDLNKPPRGFKALFNGKDLTGWKGLVGNPKTRAAMSEAELAAAQAKADEDMRAHWKVVDGALEFDGAGHSLCTAKDYADFEMLVDWKIEAGGDSGIYLRGSPQVQIWDTDNRSVGAQVGSGGLYNNKKGLSEPLKVADWPIGEWNRFRIFMIEDRVTVYLNDELVVDRVAMENYWERDKDIYRQGQLELQAHNSMLKFRNIFIREIPMRTRKTNTLTKQERTDGFKPLFNGKDLAGWKGLLKRPYDNPAKRAALAADQLEELQEEADANMRAHWQVIDGALVFDGGGRSLCTAKDYGDFEMLVDWKIKKNGDSGIYLRGSPQVQIWDTARNNAEVGSGGLYNNQKHASKPTMAADIPVGEWNTFRIFMIGEKVTVILNGQIVADNVVMENYWDRNIPIFPTGQIELQNHGNTLYFRNIFIREIPREKGTNRLTRKERKEGFVRLFNGKNLNGWIGNTQGYAIKDGIMICDPVLGGSGNLYTEKEYGDFVFRFEFRLLPGTNNGLGIRTPLNVNAAYQGMELQILDDTSLRYAGWLQDWQHHGSIYGVVSAK
ncbi:MAG: 3-keto-disaccharide hydrolase, partial [Planctomycetota bacterium]